MDVAYLCAEPITYSRRDMTSAIVDTPPEMPGMAVCRIARDSAPMPSLARVSQRKQEVM